MNKFWQNKYLLNLFFFNGIFVLASGLLGPLYAVFVERIDDSVLAVSFSWAAFLFSTTFFLLIVAKYADLVEEKKYLVMIGYLLQAIVWLCFPQINSLTQLIVLQIILGGAEALGAPTFQAMIADHLDDGNKIKELSVWKIVLNAATAVAAVVGGLIVATWGFNVLFYSMAGLALISFAGLLINLKENNEKDN